MYATTLPRLLDTLRLFKTNPPARIATGMWQNPTWTATDFWHWFDQCLAEKINRNDPRATFRKYQPEYQHTLARDAQLVNSYAKRIRHRGRNLLATPELRRRYSHVNNQDVAP